MNRLFQTRDTALGSEVVLTFAAEISQERANEIFSQLWRTIFVFERQFSRFLPASELSQFNRRAGMKVPVSADFRQILLAAEAMGEATNGLFNPFVLPALHAVGYDHSFVPGYEKDMIDDHSKKGVATIDRLEIGETWARIPYNTAIDLGGCGKGYLADILSAQLGQEITNYWLSLGGDIVARGKDQNESPWRIAIQGAGRANESEVGYIDVPKNRPFAIATSGTSFHHGSKGHKKWHHIIDPKTLKPAETDVAVATICADSALKADVLASCAIILGANNTKQFLESHNIKDALLQLMSTDYQPVFSKFGTRIHVTNS